MTIAFMLVQYAEDTAEILFPNFFSGNHSVYA